MVRTVTHIEQDGGRLHVSTEHGLMTAGAGIMASMRCAGDPRFDPWGNAS